MRKYLCLLFVFVCSLAFPYGGYRGTYWGESFMEIAVNQNIKTQGAPVYDKHTVVYESARMLGQPTTIYYTFKQNKLNGICYSVKDTEESRQMIENLFKTKKLRLVSRKGIEIDQQGMADYLKEIKQKTCLLSHDDVITYKQGGHAILELVEQKENKPESPIQIITAEYGLDTDVHIFLGIFGDISIVYTEKLQDF